MNNKKLLKRYSNVKTKDITAKVLSFAALAGLVLFSPTSTQAEEISSLPSGENTNSASVSEARIVSEGLDKTTVEMNDPSPENLTFADAQVDLQPSPVGRGGVMTGAAAEVSDVSNFLDSMSPNITWQNINSETAQQYNWSYPSSSSLSETKYNTDASNNLLSAEGAIKFVSPNSEVSYYAYTYTVPEGYEKQSGINSLTEDFIGGYFYNSGVAMQLNPAGRANGQNISADFLGNEHHGNSWSGGAAIQDLGNNLGNINGNFIGNKGFIIGTQGAAVRIYGTGVTIGTIEGNFIANANIGANNCGGGAVGVNRAYVEEIKGNFISNFSSGEAGALYVAPYASVNTVNANFIGNYASTSGGAVTLFNQSVVNSIYGNFIYNKAANSGGAISNSNSSNIKLITANFENNSSLSNGGAIYNDSTIGVTDSSGTLVDGGIIDSIFKNNYLMDSSGTLKGGAIFNSGKIYQISGEFDNNIVEPSSGYPDGGAIYNTGFINSINASFSNNTVKGGRGSGGAIANFNSPQINSITGKFDNNKVIVNNNSGSLPYANGGAIKQAGGTIDYINAEFTNNSVTRIATSSSLNAGGGAIQNEGASSVIKTILGKFISNTTYNNNGGNYGGAIHNSQGIIGTIGNSDNAVLFENNSLSSDNSFSMGGAIRNTGEIGNITGYFKGNSALGTVITSNNTSVVSGGGAIYNLGTIGTVDTNGDLIGGIVNSNFTDNYVKSNYGISQGGAIWTNRDLNVIADNGESLFKGNYVQVGDGEKDYQAIWVDGAGTKLNLEQKNNGKMYMYDNINGTDGYTVNIKGDGTGTYYMLNDIYNANVEFNNTTINTVNNNIHVYNFNKLTVTGDTKFVPDVDLEKEEMDRFTAGEYGAHAGNINVVGMNMLSDTTKDAVSIYFAEEGLMNNVVSKINEIPTTEFQTTAYTPIYKYNVNYLKDTDKYNSAKEAGYFVFTKGDKIIEDVIVDPDNHTVTPVSRSTGNKSDAFNPAIMAAPAAAQGIAQVSMNHVFNISFEHSDGFMPLPSVERMSMLRDNQYALNDIGGVSTDYNDNLDLNSFTDLDHTNKAIWVKPYTSFERINLHNGPKVDMISYGTLLGGDSDFRKLKGGWSNVGTLYIGYNGASIDYDNVDSTFNGGVLGITESFYKKNFFTAITASAGAGFTEAHTMYGHDEMTMLMAGVASKTGYNFEFKEGKFIIQPSLLLSYSMINTFDYKNAAGVKIDSDPLHTIQLNPSVRFIANLKNGWQPYASVGMVWNLMNETNVTANGVKLPESHTKPYVEYGVGVQKHFKETFSGYAQAMVRNGGRNGIALTAGFRWALPERKHKDKKDNKNVNKEVNTLVNIPQEVVENNQPLTRNSNLNDISVRISDPLPKVEGTKSVVKSVKQNSKANNLARYNELIGN